MLRNPLPSLEVNYSSEMEHPSKEQAKPCLILLQAMSPPPWFLFSSLAHLKAPLGCFLLFDVHPLNGQNLPPSLGAHDAIVLIWKLQFWFHPEGTLTELPDSELNSRSHTAKWTSYGPLPELGEATTSAERFIFFLIPKVFSKTSPSGT